MEPIRHTKRGNAALKWVVAEAPERIKRQALTDAVANLHPVIADLLLQRGLDTFEAVRDFFNPSLDMLDELGELADLERAVLRVADALANGERIMVYGDYDVDGTCSVAMMYRFLKGLGAEVTYYIPDRYGEGYGISAAGVAHAADAGMELVITLDCGIAAVEQVAKGNALGLDFIICDHHIPGPVMPPAYAVLNPQRADCAFKGKELCGCGVGFMLVRALSQHLGLPDETWESQLGLVAVATCCDIVPLTGINRALVYTGLQALDADPPAGIDALLKVAGFNGSLTVADVVFKIGPRINAAGRLRHASLAAELLITEDRERAGELAAEIEQLNLERRTLDKQITLEAVEIMTEGDPDHAHHATVVHSEGWHKGLIGIVASRLTEVCYRPTVVLTESNGMLTGSARSIDGFNLYAAIEACSETLVQFGGHQSAAGLTMRPEMLIHFTEQFRQVSGSLMNAEDRIPKLYIDLEIDFEAWFTPNPDVFTRQLLRLGPFGPANMEPLFLTKGCKARYVRLLKNEHVSFVVYQPDRPDIELRVIAFQRGAHFDDLHAGKPFSMVYTISEQVWQGNKRIQLEAKDIRF
jgi:single-stranded-DNA-specific exonuclease